MRRTRLGRSLAVTTATLVVTLQLSTVASDARPTYTSKATVTRTVAATATARMSATATASASVGSPPVTAHGSGTASVARSARVVTRSTATAVGRAHSRRQARRAAQRRAAARAITRARAAASSAAKARARYLAHAAAVGVARQRASADAKTTAASHAPVEPVAEPCGGVTPARVGGGHYTTCTLNDDFEAGSLDPTRWTALDATTTNFKIGDECFDPDNVVVDSGTLELVGSRETESRVCAGREASYNSGLVTTQGKFSQTGGRFEIRAKFPQGHGYGSGIWMVPENPMASGAYEYGEIDIVENWGQYPDLMWSHLHYVETPGSPAGGASCRVDADADADAFHTYAVDWSPSRMTFFFDGTPCWTTTWNPAPPYAPADSTAPAPFDQPFDLILNLSLGGTTSTAADPLSDTVMGKAMSVDYVRVWK